MNAEIIAVVSGWVNRETIEGNFEYLKRLLNLLGINVAQTNIVDNNTDGISEAFAAAKDRSNIIITLSDLDSNDFTMSTICKRAGVTLLKRKQDEDLSGSGEPYALPEKSAVFKTDGAFACVFENKNTLVMMLPARQEKMLTLFCGEIIKQLSNLSDYKVYKKTVGLYGVGIDSIKEKLRDMTRGNNIFIVPLKKGGEVEVMIFVASFYEETAMTNLDILAREIEHRFPQNCYGVDVGSPELRVVELLKQHKLKIATAESCTAGLLSKRLTDVPGASEVFEFGVSAYSGEIKKNVLKINEETLRRHGEVSAETACAMAEHVRIIGKANLGVGITGIAGPGGGTREKPVGLVYVALSDGKNIWVTKLLGKGSREECRNLSASHALDLVRRYIEALPGTLEGGNRISSSGPASRAKGERYEVEDVASVTAERLEEAYDDGGYTDVGVEDFGVYEGGDAAAVELEEPDEDYEDGDDTFLDAESSFHAPEKRGGLSGLKDKVKNLLFTYIIPKKGDSTAEIIRKFIFVVALLVFAGAGTMLLKESVVDPIHNLEVINKVKDMIGNDEPVDDPIPNVQPIMQRPAKENPDFFGWLSIPNLKIDLPVMRDHPDNQEYYLRRNFNKEYSKYGTPFLDSRNRLDGSDRNLIIYGHNMKNKQMFGRLPEYRSLKTYASNPTISFNTLYENTEWKIFAVMLTNVGEKEGPVFYYWRPDFRNDAEFMQFVDDIKIRSIINTTVDVKADDKLLMLSTCAYDVPDARFVVVARRVRPGESVKVDTSKATLNPDPLYPDAWYVKNKKQKSQRLIDYMKEYLNRKQEVIPPPPGGDKHNPDLVSSTPESSDSSSSVSSGVSSGVVSEDYSSYSSNASSNYSSSSSSVSSESTSGGNQEEGIISRDTPIWYKDQEGNVGSLPAFELFVRIVSMEMDESFETEALKAQAVATYTFYLYSSGNGLNNSEKNPFVCSVRSGSLSKFPKAWNAVDEVFGDTLLYTGVIVYAPYFDCSAGVTNSCRSVYGNELPHLQSVESPDSAAKYYQSSVTYYLEDTVRWIANTSAVGLTREEIEGFIAENGPEKLFVITERDPVSNYVTSVTIAGKNTLANGKPITGRTVREQIYTVDRTGTSMRFRSHHFSVSFNSETNSYEFDVKGYGHGVGMSQQGANQMAKDGKNYIQILSHYYTGIEIRNNYAG